MAEFKVGDRVTSQYYPPLPRGKYSDLATGTIMRVNKRPETSHNYMYGVVFDHAVDSLGGEYGAEGWWCRIDHLTLIRSRTPMEQMIEDISK